jgi:hypothetical protein
MQENTMSVDPAILRQILRYDPDTGKLFWRHRSSGFFLAHGTCASWNSKFAGREAFTYTTRHGYKQGAVFNRLYLAHRVIWAIQTGEWPTGEIDHADCNGCNNSWANLRKATRCENISNTRRRADNTSGVKGVNWDAARGKWKARINTERREVSLGRFDSLEAAAAAVREARRAVHGQFARD